MIRILSAHFRGFRTLQDATIPFRHTTVIVGPNNVGKTAVLEGLERALGLGRRSYGFDERDVSDGVDPAQGFSIVIQFGPMTGDKLTPDEVAAFPNHVDVLNGAHRIHIAVEGSLDPDEGVFRTRLRYRKSDGGDDGPVSATERQRLGVLLLPAVRETRHEFAERGGLWPKLVSGNGPDEATRTALERLGEAAGTQVVDSLLGKARAAEVKESMTELVSSVLFADVAQASLTYSLLPEDATQAMMRVEVRMTSPDQVAAHRIGGQSIGTQSVAMVGLFNAYAKGWGDRLVSIGIEEPEAHLHPHATRSIARKLGGIGAQVIVTTHSTAITDETDPRDVVRLRRHGRQTTAHAIDPESVTESDVGSIRRHILDSGSDFVFARAILLTEGPSERLAFPELGRQLGHDFDALGITVVPTPMAPPVSRARTHRSNSCRLGRWA